MKAKQEIKGQKIVSPSPSILNNVNKERYDSLDGLRAFAALGIVVMHVLSNIVVKPSGGLLTERIIPFFTHFTLMFMLISAFSMCCGYYNRFRNNDIALDDFYRKRYARILPFFASLVLLDVVLSPSLESLYEGFADLTLAFGLLPNADIKVIGVGWFLGVIFVFYMLFPFFTFLMGSKRRAWWVFFIAWGLCYLADNYFTPTAGRENIVYSSVFFISGGLIYLYRDTLVRMVRQWKWLVGLLCIVAFVLYMSLPGIDKIPMGFEVAMVVLFSLWVIYTIGCNDYVLQNRFTKYVSGISMEIYLCHMVIFRVIERIHLEKVVGNAEVLYILTCVLTIVGAVIFSHVMKFWILPKDENLVVRK